MWLKLTTVKFLGSQKNQKSIVIISRINFNMIESYSEAPEEIKNNKSENARANTLLYLSGGGNMVYHVKETVDQIDDMIAAYGIENFVVDPEIEKEKEDDNSWNKSSW